MVTCLSRANAVILIAVVKSLLLQVRIERDGKFKKENSGSRSVSVLMNAQSANSGDIRLKSKEEAQTVGQTRTAFSCSVFSGVIAGRNFGCLCLNLF